MIGCYMVECAKNAFLSNDWLECVPRPQCHVNPYGIDSGAVWSKNPTLLTCFNLVLAVPHQLEECREPETARTNTQV